ncbi:hypothetical protein M404DRAFT_36610 [Pisolithus tinctorius Marx 270]|uniref:Uncharacterized protein n=1 Tax=Pisolithus tinctorius Marx 270 TaxID=870435 RepID=A0A0C3MVG6_PISTI|nr:hypothetical protein M404DRAFT_36610 [Pisolithus tinctorius Marx 270]
MAKTTKVLANNIRVLTLVALCHKLGISIDDPKQPGKVLAKMCLVALLGKWCVEHGLADMEGNLIEHCAEPTAVDPHETPMVLGHAVLKEVERPGTPSPSVLHFSSTCCPWN